MSQNSEMRRLLIVAQAALDYIGNELPDMRIEYFTLSDSVKIQVRSHVEVSLVAECLGLGPVSQPSADDPHPLIRARKVVCEIPIEVYGRYVG
jgi:hypothetical protein